MHQETMENLLQHGLIVHPEDVKNPGLLNTAVEKGVLKIVEDLLKDGANVNTLASSNFGERMTPLHIAVEGKQVEMAKLLINYGADVNMLSNSEFRGSVTPLHIAVEGKQVEMAKLLINYGADVNMLNNSEFAESVTPLHIAVEENQVEMAKLLIDYGADVNKLPNSEFIESTTPLHIATCVFGVEMVKLLINYGANVNVKNSKGTTPIVYAIENHNTEKTKLLLRNGADIKNNPEVLCIAVENGCLEIVEILLNYGADVNASNQYGKTALHYTVLYFEDNEHSLLYRECNGARVEIAELLLSKGANVNAPNRRGITTLCAASRKGYRDIVEILLKHGADPVTEEDTKPLHAAAVGGHPRIIENLLKFGAEVDSRDIYGRTALHFAVRQGCKDSVETLLKYGSDVNVISEKNHTPLEYGMLVDDDYDGDDYDGDDYHYNLHYVSNTNDSTATWILKQHIAKMKAAGLQVSERNLLGISNDHEINKFLNECEAEIENMKSEKIDNSCASFYDILTKNTCQLARNESIAQALKSNDYKTKYPIYASMINRRFRRWVEREELLEQVRNKFSRFLFEWFPKLPILCVEKIFSYLSDRDLGILLVACELSG